MFIRNNSGKTAVVLLLILAVIAAAVIVYEVVKDGSERARHQVKIPPPMCPCRRTAAVTPSDSDTTVKLGSVNITFPGGMLTKQLAVTVAPVAQPPADNNISPDGMLPHNCR